MATRPLLRWGRVLRPLLHIPLVYLALIALALLIYFGSLAYMLWEITRPEPEQRCMTVFIVPATNVLGRQMICARDWQWSSLHPLPDELQDDMSPLPANVFENGSNPGE